MKQARNLANYNLFRGLRVKRHNIAFENLIFRGGNSHVAAKLGNLPLLLHYLEASFSSLAALGKLRYCHWARTSSTAERVELILSMLSNFCSYFYLELEHILDRILKSFICTAHHFYPIFGCASVT